eukprot:scaffold26757_cov68-Isochrysis_galbana.AAC.1
MSCGRRRRGEAARCEVCRTRLAPRRGLHGSHRTLGGGGRGGGGFVPGRGVRLEQGRGVQCTCSRNAHALDPCAYFGSFL